MHVRIVTLKLAVSQKVKNGCGFLSHGTLLYLKNELMSSADFSHADTTGGKLK